MKLFRVVRLSIWALIIALAVIVVGLYISATQTVLSKPQLMLWAEQGNVMQAMRDSVLAPKIISATESNQPTGFQLLTPTVIRESLMESLPPNTLKKYTPSVVEGVYNWLDSRQSTIEFSLPISSVQTDFFAALSRNLADEMAKLPACTWQNTSADISDGVCSLNQITSSQIHTDVMSTIEDNASNIFGSAITAHDLISSDGSGGLVGSIPNDLNILYASALFMGGLGIASGLWLLVKKRLPGLIALGAGGVVGGGVLVGIGILTGQTLSRVATPASFHSLRAHFAASIQHTITVLGAQCFAISLCITIVGIVGLLIWRRFHQATPIPVHHRAVDAPRETIDHHL
ncbi:MAG TPA: hypothetical protein VFQ70_01355 [Candidatus Saccharimonadaceae bacterium]|nr:hypothetical protein [Candidatus Saccharimonadaceae bacterium]